MRDIENLKDIQLLVDDFYGKIRKDSLLGPVFNSVISDWDQHLNKMYRFWQTLLLNEGTTYFGNPFIKHQPLPISPDHFSQWLKLWEESIHMHFEGLIAEEAIFRAQKVAYVFQMRLFGRENISNFAPGKV